MRKRLAVLLVLLGAAAAYAVLGRPGDASRGRAVRIGTPVGGRIEKTDAEWQAALTPEAYRVTRRRGTELACSGAYWKFEGDGVFVCVDCGQPLFDTKTKFNSGTGWPSFWQPVNEDAVSLFEDHGLMGTRTEIVCSRCDAHLGHVFNDGPPPTGQRYCMNSAALKFVPRDGK